ncbi:MAG: DUF4374 domain-containing protein [Balneolaceae bacterium]|nr:DUF4374 domain-containing protein [Balneolaceae bacterium]
MRSLTTYVTLLISVLLLTNCDDSVVNDDGDNAEVTSQYVVAASPNALEDAADYLLTVDDLSEGSVSTIDNGVEQDGTWRYYVTDHEQTKFFSFLYSSSGAVTTYQLDSEGELEVVADFQSDRVHAFAPVQDDILSMQIPRGGEPNAYWYRLDSESVQFTDEGQINTQELAPGDEWAYYSWLAQVGEDKVFAPFFSIKACCNDVFGTEYPDQAWIAVYNYPSMELETVIQDDRTSFIGKYYTNGLAVDENNDVYAFSSSLADNNSEYNSTQPSAVTRINSGELEFDQDYFFNLQEASGGYVVTNHIYAGDGKAVVFMGEKSQETYNPYMVGTRLAVVNLYDQTFEWVTGVPDTSEITSMMTRNNFASEDGSTAYTGITTEDGSYVYSIDIATATAERGLHVEGGVITAIHKLNVPEE